MKTTIPLLSHFNKASLECSSNERKEGENPEVPFPLFSQKMVEHDKTLGQCYKVRNETFFVCTIPTHLI